MFSYFEMPRAVVGASSQVICGVEADGIVIGVVRSAASITPIDEEDLMLRSALRYDAIEAMAKTGTWLAFQNLEADLLGEFDTRDAAAEALRLACSE